MTARERVRAAIRHQATDKIPIDLGGCVTTGIHASALAKLRDALELQRLPVKIVEPMMMLGEVDEELRRAVRGDTVGLNGPSSLLGYRNEGWKPWRLPDGTDVLMGGGFRFTTDADGTIFAYPNGNTSARPSARMPKDGFYFDNVIRQEDLMGHNFDARKDYADQYPLFSDEDCRYYEKESKRLYEGTECSVFGNFFLGGVGDIFHVPAAWLEHPKGIRDLEEWMIATHTHPDYVKDFFDMQLEVELKNLGSYRQAVGNRIDVIAVSGTDFGSQDGLLISREAYREFYKPYHTAFNEWVHKNTTWKTFYHTCGSVVEIMEDLIESGVDIINPVQVSARGMDPTQLKARYGKRIVFWGGSVNPQKTLPFGTPEEVAAEARRNVAVFAQGGGYVFAGIHNIQANTPASNIVAMFEAANEAHVTR